MFRSFFWPHSWLVQELASRVTWPAQRVVPAPAPAPVTPGLRCSGGQCLAESGGTASPIDPLPHSTFVFFRYSLGPTNAWTYQLWALDAVSKSERLISRLDDALVPGELLVGHGLALSPDRRWVAFAAFFRPSDHPADRSLGRYTKMVWKVSVDGKQYVRISPPLEDPRTPLLRCTPQGRRGCRFDGSEGVPGSVFRRAPWGRGRAERGGTHGRGQGPTLA